MDLYEFLKMIGDIGIIIIIISFVIFISLICAIFETRTNTEQTARELKEIKHQNEYICQALNYMINNDGNFRADKPQYRPYTPPKQVGIITWLFNKEYRDNNKPGQR